jgi:hypothetical protein
VWILEIRGGDPSIKRILMMIWVGEPIQIQSVGSSPINPFSAQQLAWQVPVFTFYFPHVIMLKWGMEQAHRWVGGQLHCSRSRVAAVCTCTPRAGNKARLRRVTRPPTCPSGQTHRWPLSYAVCHARTVLKFWREGWTHHEHYSSNFTPFWFWEDGQASGKGRFSCKFFCKMTP